MNIESGNYYDFFFKDVSDPVCIVNKELKIMYSNNQLNSILDYDSEELIGLDFCDISFDEFYFKENMSEKLMDIFSENKSIIDYPLSFKKNDGSRVMLNITNSKFFVRNGLDSNVIVCKDFNKINIKKSLFESVYKYCNDAVFILSYDVGEILDCNNFALSLFSAKSITDLTGKKFDDISVMNEKSIVSLKEKYKQISMKKSCNFKWENRRLSGTVFPSKVTFWNIKVGLNQYILVFLKDNSEELLWEKSIVQDKKRIDSIMETVITGILIVEKDTNVIIEANSSAFNIFNMSKDSLIGKKWDSLIVKENKKINRLNQNFLFEEVFLIDSLNRKIPIIYNENEVKIDNRIVVIKSFMDISERVNQEKARVNLEKELNHSHKLEAIGTLAAGIAHEINTPIQFIENNNNFVNKGVSKLINIIEGIKESLDAENADKLDDIIDNLLKKNKYMFLKEELPKALEQSNDGVERVAKIVSAMKDFSHMGINEEMKEENINSGIESTIIISKNEWKYHAELNTDLEKTLPKVFCLIGDIKQVILNLIVNASHAIEEKNIENPDNLGSINIKTYSQDDFVFISIKDNGIGIKEEYKEKIFEHFFTTKEVGKGSGQGLSMAYNSIVNKHKGDIIFNTEYGKGTEFIIKLPIINK